MAIGAMSLYGQEQVYRYSPSDVEAVINSLVKSYAKDDPEKQTLYHNIISEAFTRYWTLKETQAPVSPNSISQIKSEADSLSTVLAQRGDTQNVQSDIDTLQSLLAEYLSLNDSVAQQTKCLAEKQKEIELVNFNISRLETQIADAKARADIFSQTEDSLKIIADNLMQAYKKAQSKDDFSGVDIAEKNNLVDQYISSRRLIEAFNVADIKELDNAVKSLETLSSLQLLVDDAIEAMSSKFIPSRNKALIEGIRIEAAKPGPTSAQKELLTSIVYSLQNQQGAVDDFLSILDKLPNDYYCVPDDETRDSLHLDKYIIERVKAFNNTLPPTPTESASNKVLETYDVRYKQLNSTLQQLLEDLSPNSKMPITKINTNEKFLKYLQTMASKVSEAK